MYIIIVHSIWLPRTSPCAAWTLQYVCLILPSQGVAPSLAARISSILLAGHQDFPRFDGVSRPLLNCLHNASGTGHCHRHLTDRGAQLWQILSEFFYFFHTEEGPLGLSAHLRGARPGLAAAWRLLTLVLPPHTQQRPCRWHLFSQLRQINFLHTSIPCLRWSQGPDRLLKKQAEES